MKQTITFLHQINKETNLLIRPYVTDRYKWFIKERIIDSGLRFKFDDLSKKLRNRMRESSICVFADLSTTYQESLVMNKPTVIFINPDIFQFRSSAKPYFEQLREVKILHYSPESAAQHINNIYFDVEKWWFGNKVQAARETFVYQYARADKNWAEKWAEEFERVLSSP